MHPSLRRVGGKTASTRNVLKRHERLQYLMTKGLWQEGRSIFGLPKIKQEKVKAKKAATKDETAKQTEATPPKTS